MNITQSANDTFSGGGQLGDVCLFDAQYVSGSAGNLILAIDGNGDGRLEANDIMFDVEDDINNVTYDGTNDVFVFLRKRVVVVNHLLITEDVSSF